MPSRRRPPCGKLAGTSPEMRVVSPKQARDGDGGPVSQIARSAIRRPARAPEGGRRPGHSPSTGTPRPRAACMRRTCARRCASGCRGCSGGLCATASPTLRASRPRSSRRSRNGVRRSRSGLRRRVARVGGRPRGRRWPRGGPRRSTGSRREREASSSAPARPSWGSARASSPSLWAASRSSPRRSMRRRSLGPSRGRVG
jgi:hypothetical protein